MTKPESEKVIAEYLAMSEPELLVEIGRLRVEGPELRSPDALIAETRAFLATLRPKLQELVCPHAYLFELPELRLALAVAGILTGVVAIAVAEPIAAYIARRGLKELCGMQIADD